MRSSLGERPPLEAAVTRRRDMAIPWLSAAIAVLGACLAASLQGAAALLGVAVGGVAGVALVRAATRERQRGEAALRHAAEAAEALEAAQIDLRRLGDEVTHLSGHLRAEAQGRQQAESKLIDSVRTKDAFLAMMSHELRTPMNQIIGYCELLGEEADEMAADQLRADVENIRVAATNLLEVLTNILELSRIETGRVSVLVEPFPAAELIESLVQGFASHAARQGNILRVRCPADIGSVKTDRAKLRSILSSLLSNACKFTRGGIIRLAVSVETTARGAFCVFEVSDTGIGIDPRTVDRLFQTFIQGDGSPTRRHDGAGLGLAITRHFCAMLGGDIAVTSEPYKGSTFRVRIPRDFIDPWRAGLVEASGGR